MKSEGGEEKRSKENTKKENIKQAKQKERKGKLLMVFFFFFLVSKSSLFLPLPAILGWSWAWEAIALGHHLYFVLLNPIFCTLMWFSWGSGWLGSGVGSECIGCNSHGGRKMKMGHPTRLLKSKKSFPGILHLPDRFLILWRLGAVTGSWPSKPGSKPAVGKKQPRPARRKHCCCFK